MIRYIKIEDNNKRDAEITFKSVRSGDLIYLALENGEKPINKRVIKSTNENSLEYLIDKSGQRTVPYVYIGKKLIGGDDEFEKGVKNGSIKATLNQLGVKNDF